MQTISYNAYNQLLDKNLFNGEKFLVELAQKDKEYPMVFTGVDNIKISKGNGGILIVGTINGIEWINDVKLFIVEDGVTTVEYMGEEMSYYKFLTLNGFTGVKENGCTVYTRTKKIMSYKHFRIGFNGDLDNYLIKIDKSDNVIDLTGIKHICIFKTSTEITFSDYCQFLNMKTIIADNRVNHFICEKRRIFRVTMANLGLNCTVNDEVRVYAS